MLETDVEQLVNHTQVMSHQSDIAIAGMFLRKLKADSNQILTIAELGTGAGGWVKAMHALGATASWVLVDNFVWSESNFNQQAIEWPGPEQLRTSLNEFDASILINDIYAYEVNDMIKLGIFDVYKNNLDVIRVDCDISADNLEHLIQNCANDNALVFVDDFKSNCGLFRIVTAIELVQKGLLHFVWLGEKEAMFVTNPIMVDDYINHLIEQSQYFNKLVETHRVSKWKIYPNIEAKYMLGRDYKYVSTTNFQVYKPKESK